MEKIQEKEVYKLVVVLEFIGYSYLFAKTKFPD
jgi:hypothetical protein